MTELVVKVLKADPELPTPTYAHAGDAALDLHARISVEIAPNGGRAGVPTGLHVEIPLGYAGFVQPRSGLALHHGITVLNAPGLIDSGYRGELVVILINTDPLEPYQVTRGERIAQLVIQQAVSATLVEVQELSATSRGAGGFGHTG